MKLPPVAEQYLIEEFDQIDYQAEQIEAKTNFTEDTDEFQPQPEYDASNKYFS
jgi:hypothetical protein